jgi:MSHA biogenesis protein MshP
MFPRFGSKFQVPSFKSRDFFSPFNLELEILNFKRRAQRGFSIVTAIFLIVVLAGLGVFIVSVTGLQQSSSQLDVQGVRAYQAARAGIEWAAYQVLDPNNTLGSALAPCASTNLTGLAGSLSAFTVTVTCVSSDATEGNRNIRVFQVTATGCNSPGTGPPASCPAAPATGYVERQLQATLTKCKDPTAAAPRFACG